MNTTTQSLTAENIIENILNTKGAFVKVLWHSFPDPAAAHKHVELKKVTSAVCRAGINYANLAPVKEAIEAGERGEVEPLPWGQWYVKDGKSFFPYIIEHKGELYIRLYPSSNEKQLPKTKYFVNGEEVTKQKFAEYLTPANAKKLLESEEHPLCFTLKQSNILGTEEYNEEIVNG